MNIRLAAATAVTLLAATTFAAPATADNADQVATQICTTLSEDPQPDTVGAIGLWLMASGADAETAAAAVVYSVLEYCPKYFDIVRAYGQGAAGKKLA